MNISIALRLKPFSHTAGSKCLLPGTTKFVEAFPDFIRIGDISIPLEENFSLSSFTLQQDLEKNCVWVFGKSFRYKIQASSEGFEVKSSSQTSFFKRSHSFQLPEEEERLSLGCHKAQDWDLVTRRMDVKEILPFLFSLSQKGSWANNPSREIPKMLSLQEITHFYRSHFEAILVPKKSDKESLLKETFQTIRSLFFKEEDSTCFLLQNCLFPEGRMTNLQVEGGSLHFEWSFYRLKRVVFYAKKTGALQWKFPENFKSYRLRALKNEKGSMKLVTDPFLFEKEAVYFLDRFFE